MITRDSKGRVRFGWLEYVVQAIIVLSLISFALETLPSINLAQRSALRWFEIVSVTVFSVEYLARLILSKPSRAYFLSFFGLIDVIAILPFYLSLGIDLRSLRAFRLLRLFRLLKLARYSSAIQRFHRAFIIAREELVLFSATTLIILYLAAVGIYYCEHDAQPEVFTSVFTSLWWAVVTLTTVGYGDIYPVTAFGRFFTFLILILGLGVIAVPTGLVASALSKAREEEKEKQE